MQRGMGRDLNTEEEARISVLLAQLAKRFGQQEQQHRLEQQCQVKRAASRTDPSKLPCLEEPAPLEFDDIDFGPDFVSDLDDIDFVRLGLCGSASDTSLDLAVLLPEASNVDLSHTTREKTIAVQKPEMPCEMKMDLELLLQELTELPELNVSMECLFDSLGIDMEMQVAEIEGLDEALPVPATATVLVV